MEYEKKFILLKSEYEKICDSFKEANEKTQINYYYDTPDLSYNKKGITFRIRNEDANYTATIKKHYTNNRDYSVEKSYEAINQYDIEHFGNTNLFFYGSLTTYRKKIDLGNSIHISIDKNVYLGKEDYELEIEYDPEYEYAAHYALREIVEKICGDSGDFNRLMADFYCRDKNRNTKSERFFERKSKICRNEENNDFSVG